MKDTRPSHKSQKLRRGDQGVARSGIIRRSILPNRRDVIDFANVFNRKSVGFAIQKSEFIRTRVIAIRNAGDFLKRALRKVKWCEINDIRPVRKIRKISRWD